MAWSSKASGVYLREEPNGRILVTLENGTPLRILPETQEAAGVTWVHVLALFSNSQPAGWIAQGLILPSFSISADELAIVQGNEEGVYLRADPSGGQVVAVLHNGTRLQVLESRQVQGQVWTRVRVPDGTEGWIAGWLVATPTAAAMTAKP